MSEQKPQGKEQEIAAKQATIKKVSLIIRIAMFAGIAVVLIVLALILCKNMGILGDCALYPVNEQINYMQEQLNSINLCFVNEQI